MNELFSVNKLFSAHVEEYIGTDDGKFIQRKYKTVVLKENGNYRDVINNKLLDMSPTHKCYLTEIIPLYPSTPTHKVVDARQAQKKFNKLQNKLK
ncbi:MAG: hypothetical protein IKP76_00760 [Bacilli bacterium]|nr:hypothetical protein [Bacilli bacterium]